MTIKEHLVQRAEVMRNCSDNPELQAAAIELCKRDILAFFKLFLWTYDPRRTPSDIPFIPWDYQEPYIEETNQAIVDGQSELTEKSRDMGVTWMVLGVFLYRWLMFDESFLLGSRKQELVDTIGDMDSLFERLRYMLAKLPDWMTKECGFDKRNSGFLKIFKANGASLVGESMNKDFSRGGRYKAILLDEFAFVDGAEVIWRSCGDSAPCKLPVSTPNGKNNFFAKLRDSNKVKVSTIHWRMHPYKDENWYQQQILDRSEKDVAQELDINYSVSAGDPFYQGFSRALHLRKMNINPHKELILGWDYGFRHPNCSVHQISPEGIWIIVDNIFGEDQTIDEFAEYVNTYLNEHYPNFIFREKNFGDPAGKQSSDKSRLSSEQILRNKGFKVVSLPSNHGFTNYAARKAIIERKLRTLIGGIPSLVVNDTINNYIIVEGFEGGYRLPDSNKYGGVSEKPVDDGYFEHPFNSLEYVAVNMFRAVEKNKIQQTQRLIRYRAHSKPLQNAGFSY